MELSEKQHSVKSLATIKKITLPIQGMSCASCVNRIQSKLTTLNGIETAFVNLATESASVAFDESQISLNEIVKSIQDVGYQAIVTQEDEFDNVKQNLEDEEHRKLKIDLGIATILTIPIVIINMLLVHRYSLLNYLLFVLTLPVLLLSGRRFFIGFWKMLKHFSADMNTLVAVGTSIAFIFSAIMTFFPEIFSDVVKHPATYYDTTAVIITLILFGRMLESKAKGKASEALKKLLHMQVKTAHVIRDNMEIDIPIEQIMVNDILVVKPGEKIPLDGIVIEGNSHVDESMMTGESIPIEKQIGSEVIGSTINQSGSLIIQVKKIGNDTLLAQIVRLVEEAQTSKAPIQQLADKIASVFVPTVIIIAFASFILYMMLVPEPKMIHAIFSAVAVLVVACPCALGLATPTAILVGSLKGAEHGIIIKNSRSLEIAHKINTIVLDKTGTITYGKPMVKEVFALEPFTKETVASYSATVEKYSEHPIANAILEYARSKNINLLTPYQFDSHAGKGAEAIVDKKLVKVGNYKFLRDIIDSSYEYKSFVNEIVVEHISVIYVSIDNKLAGAITLSDKVKESSKSTIQEFQNNGQLVWMITGDNRLSSEKIAKEVGIKNIFSEMLPQDKVREIKNLQNSGNIVAMVGDGINDAPSLAQADLGIAIGTGTDIANDTGDIILVKGDLKSVNTAIQLSKRTMKTIRQNLFWAFIYNIILIPLAAFGKLDPMLAAGAMALSSVSVVSNSLRLKRFKA